MIVDPIKTVGRIWVARPVIRRTDAAVLDPISPIPTLIISIAIKGVVSDEAVIEG